MWLATAELLDQWRRGKRISCIVQQSPAFKLRERLRHESLRKAKHMSVDIVVPCSLAK